TNHLDIWACDSLEQALKDYEGTCVVVSHDRYFLNRVADLMIVFDGGTTEVVYGNYDTYELLRQAREDAARQAGGGRRPPEDSRAAARAPAPGEAKPAKRKRQFPYRKVPDIEADIATAEKKVAGLEAALQTSEVYTSPSKLRDTMADLEGAKDALAKLYQHWEEAVELNG
ncbi:MAG: ABC transporter ATP-binding protein, partial [Gemmata sp.]